MNAGRPRFSACFTTGCLPPSIVEPIEPSTLRGAHKIVITAELCQRVATRSIQMHAAAAAHIVAAAYCNRTEPLEISTPARARVSALAILASISSKLVGVKRSVPPNLAMRRSHRRRHHLSPCLRGDLAK